MADRTEDQVEADAVEGTMLGLGLLEAFDGRRPQVGYNAITALVVGIFCSVEFEQPQHALEEFDNWAAFTREHLANRVKGKMS